MTDRLTLGVSGWRLRGERTGIGRYLTSLIACWSAEVVAGRFASIGLYTPTPLDDSDIHLPAPVDNRVVRSHLPMVPWENLRLGPRATDDVVLYPSFSRPFYTRGATVVTTHDATMRIIPEMFTRSDRLVYERLYGWSARAATIVLTTSQAAKADIVNEWDVNPEKIRVTPLAAAADFHPVSLADAALTRRSVLGDDRPYFIFVGKISGRRNMPELLRAFAEFKRAGYPHKFVVVGPARAVKTVQSLADELGVRDQVVTRSFVPDVELNRLYNGADALIMPSVYENGSLPVFEAQATGCPVIAVDTQGTREITGGAAMLIPHLEAGHLVGAMCSLADDDSLLRDLAARGLANSNLYSWRRCADETLAACVEAAERGAA
ncbi:MAG: glycosyltransferase family 4 protein [Gemmatimonadaceae bacterium]|nr:glycosyltransferase family 4 protein [Gemmatimonadaceae bacterium]MDQ3242729.1 glycosyltransferase family 4 protein [Gemmatimonadota bacterium]